MIANYKLQIVPHSAGSRFGGTNWRLACLAVILLFASSAMAEELTAKEILQKASAHYTVIKDYTVEVKLSVKSPSVHVPEMPAKIYFKKPDKLQVESEDGFTVLPKQGVIVGNPLGEFIKGSGLSIAGSEKVLDADCYVIKGTSQQEGRSVQSTVWIDKKNWLVRQVHTNPEWGPSIKVKLWYSKVAKKYWLPRSTAAQISLPPIPGDESTKGKSSQPTIVYIRFSKYRVNIGLDDKIFEHPTSNAGS